jgi:hypothetical protein
VFIFTLAAALVLQAAAAPEASAAKPADAVVADAPAAPSKSRQVCKTEALIGSRVPKRVCATPAEWEARRRDDREHLDAMQRASKPHLSQ